MRVSFYTIEREECVINQKPSVAISIVTYNSQDVFATIDNLLAEIVPFYPCKIYVFDNGSAEKYQATLKSYQTSALDVIFHTENRGFGYGHNVNATRAKEDYFLICNPDILVATDDFKKLITYLVGHPNTMMAPKIVNSDLTPQYLMRRRLTVFDYMLRFIPFHFVKKIFAKRLARYECRDLSDDIQPINFISGCFMLTRRSDFMEVTGFDEHFFMYFEDNDLCQRFRQAGKQIIYFPDAKAIHFYGKGAHHNSQLFKVFMSSMAKYFNKWGWKFF